MKSKAAWILVFLWVFTLILPTTHEVKAADIEPAIIRVQLRNYIGDKQQLAVSINQGSYSVAGSPLLVLVPKHNYTVKIEAGALKLYDDSTLIGSFGSSFELVPKRYGTDNIIAINGIPYIGSMAFMIDGSYVRPINKLMLEDYLKGVVPREMPASWNKEALKAQAVAARTYAIRCIRPSAPYDVVDTTANQVYGGYQWNANSNAAVEETKGQVAEYNGSPILMEYSSSNGGIVEEVTYSDGYHISAQEDSYDPQNPWTVAYKKIQIDKAQIDAANAYLAQNDMTGLNKWWDGIESITYASRPDEKAMIAGLKSLLAPLYPGKDIRITEITDMTMDLSHRTEGQRLEANSQVAMTVKFFLKDNKTGQYDVEVVTPPQDPNVQSSDGQTSQPVPVLKASEQTLTFSVTTMRTKFNGTIIKSYLIDSFTNSSDAYVIKGMGYGHGRGMSQYGAKNRADAGQKYNDILNFYYPGTTLVNYAIPAQPVSVDNASAIPSSYNANAGDLIISYSISRDANVTVKIWDSDKQAVATVVAGAVQKAGVNSVRWSGGSLDPGNYYYTIEAVTGDGSTANAYGSFQLVKGEPPSRGETPTPPSTSKTGTVKVSTTLNVRSGAGTQYKIIGSLKNGAKVEILGQSGSWYKIKYGSITGYVSSQYVVVR